MRPVRARAPGPARSRFASTAPGNVWGDPQMLRLGVNSGYPRRRVQASVKQNISRRYAAATIVGRRGDASGSAPHVSYGVITVCKNSAATIRRTIDSVLAQTVPPYEYVFVDGGSRDATVAIIESVMADSQRRGLR